MAKEYRKPRGRPVTWYKDITAPPEALQLYKLIAQLQKSDAFQTCHIFRGASLGGEPVIKFDQKVTKLANVVASYIGLPSAKRQCDTPDCCNPFHYVPPGEDILVSADEAQNEVLVIGLEDWVDLVEYTMDKHEVKPDHATFEEIRPLIMAEDLLDDQLVAALEHIGEKDGNK
jgi:hypothetical protein